MYPTPCRFISSRLTDPEYAAGKAVDIVRDRPPTHFDDPIHLRTGINILDSSYYA
jgi:hypothetical protein